MSWQGEGDEVGFYGESEGKEGAFKLKQRGKRLKRKGQSACFVWTDKKRREGGEMEVKGGD